LGFPSAALDFGAQRPEATGHKFTPQALPWCCIPQSLCQLSISIIATLTCGGLQISVPYYPFAEDAAHFHSRSNRLVILIIQYYQCLNAGAMSIFISNIARKCEAWIF